ncbi:MAG: class I SAM-dependent methyltransferase [Silicimonas sp.]|jgi:predicted TPR repeat methyltransferase|nr:class I SAM-dependent methyltransferase [Silicimonas sp.]
MESGQHDGHLGTVYAAEGPDEVARSYDAWAETYETDMARAGYRHPSVCLGLLARHCPRGAAPILDAGCGTGLLGEWLGLLAYPEVEGLDLSEGMLAVAGRKGCYRRLYRLALGETLPFPDDAYAGIVSAGVFTTGHVGVGALGELARICRTNGVLVVTVKRPMWEDGFAGHAAEAGFALIEATDPYVSMPGEGRTIPSVAAVFRKA